MNTFFTTLLIGISLSMDAFSLSLIYGLQPLLKKDKIQLSLVVGIYHFIMPLIGYSISYLLSKYIFMDLNILVSIIFIIIGIEMIISSTKSKEEKILMNIISLLIFGLSVSVDSLTTGLGLDAINQNHLQVSLVFAITSSLLTYIGLILGNKLNEKIGNYSTIIGGFILIILAMYYIF